MLKILNPETSQQQQSPQKDFANRVLNLFCERLEEDVPDRLAKVVRSHAEVAFEKSTPGQFEVFPMSEVATAARDVVPTWHLFHKKAFRESLMITFKEFTEELSQYD